MRELASAIIEQFQLPLDGIHGLEHWARVCSNGYHLADREGLDCELVEYFALLHDACREDDGRDPEHGLRAANLATAWRGIHFDLTDADFERLTYALRLHSGGLLDADPIVEVCWDADRLDLTRIGVTPMPGLLCTESARAVVEGSDELPPVGEEAFLIGNWGVDLAGEPAEDELWEDLP
jgi:uncharacterized protein